MRLTPFVFPAILAATAGFADAPSVLTDIPPVHSLAAQVMEGVGTPGLIMDRAASAHSGNLRPSQAKALNEADFVFWIGPGLSQWLEEPIETLAKDAQHHELMKVPGLELLETRESAAFEHDDHGHGGDHDDDHDHDKYEDHVAKDDHDDHAHGHEHHHDGPDPHAWLDPDNAALWLTYIADTIAAADPENAATYLANAETARAALAAQVAELTPRLAAVGDLPFIVSHDAYQYFEVQFGLEALGAVASSDAEAPSPARLAELTTAAEGRPPKCNLHEPGQAQKTGQALFAATGIKAVEVDPLGMSLEHGKGQYSALLAQITEALESCAQAG